MTKKELKEILNLYYKTAAINHILRGIRKPSYEKILKMHKEHGVPFDAWSDIKSYLQSNRAKAPDDKTRLKE